MVTVADLAALLGIPEGTDTAALQAAIDSVRVVDAQGYGPADPRYTPTSEVWLAAAAYVEALAVKRTMGELTGPDAVDTITSEGTTIRLRSVSGDTLHGFAGWLRSRSPLTQSTAVSVTTIDNGGDWFPVSSFYGPSLPRGGTAPRDPLGMLHPPRGTW